MTRFAHVPGYSKGEINRAGLVVADEKPETPKYKKARKVVEEWRACHSYPMNTFQVTLRNKLKRLRMNNAIVAQRLKRFPTIVDKLDREPSMQLARMQDIGGVRAVVPSMKDLKVILKNYQSSTFEHEFLDEKDYLANPKDDGYRSIHLYYRYKNKKSEYNGLRLEIQFRTKLQHYWATAVETMMLFLGEPLKFKTRQSDKKWKDFFIAVSAAFAHIEGTANVPGYEHLDKAKTFEEVRKKEKAINALRIMRGITKAVEDSKGIGYYYHLITLYSQPKLITEIVSYPRDSAKEASDAYARAEERIAAGEQIEVVLVSAGTLEETRKAYPSFFLNIDDFIASVQKIVSKKL